MHDMMLAGRLGVIRCPDGDYAYQDYGPVFSGALSWFLDFNSLVLVVYVCPRGRELLVVCPGGRLGWLAIEAVRVLAC